jgi:hypothetical protein
MMHMIPSRLVLAGISNHSDPCLLHSAADILLLIKRAPACLYDVESTGPTWRYP